MRFVTKWTLTYNAFEWKQRGISATQLSRLQALEHYSIWSAQIKCALSYWGIWNPNHRFYPAPNVPPYRDRSVESRLGTTLYLESNTTRRSCRNRALIVAFTPLKAGYRQTGKRVKVRARQAESACNSHLISNAAICGARGLATGNDASPFQGGFVRLPARGTVMTRDADGFESDSFLEKLQENQGLHCRENVVLY